MLLVLKSKSIRSGSQRTGGVEHFRANCWSETHPVILELFWLTKNQKQCVLLKQAGKFLRVTFMLPLLLFFFFKHIISMVFNKKQTYDLLKQNLYLAFFVVLNVFWYIQR